MEINRDDLTQIRRKFHQYPETLWTEFWTTAKICEYLEAWRYKLMVGSEIIQPTLRRMVPPQENIENAYQRAKEWGAPEKCLHKMEGGLTGVMGMLDTGREGPTFQYEADIDALPIKESEEESHVPFKEGWGSKNEGNMHACGHDVHITMGLGVAEWISKNIEKLRGKFVLTFTPAEEGGHGALSFSKLPVMKEIDYYFAYHVAVKPLGGMFLVPRVFLRSIEIYEVEFRAKKSKEEQALLLNLVQEMQEGKLKTHLDLVNAYVERYKRIPLKSENTLKAAISAYFNLQGIPKRMDGQFQLSIMEFKQGEYPNHSITFKLIIRADNNNLTDYLAKSSHLILNNAAKSFGVRVKIKRDQEWCYPAWEQNNTELIKLAEQVWKKFYGNTVVKHSFGEMGTDDDVYMMNTIVENGGKCFYGIIASDTNGNRYGELHTNNFNIDERVIEAGIGLTTHMINRILEKHF